MRWSKLFIPTLRDEPAEAKNATHLIRAGYMRRQDYLFLGRRVLRKIVSVVREELEAIGAQQMLFSSGLSIYNLVLELRSYKQLPQIWFQFNQFKVEGWLFDQTNSSATACIEALRLIVAKCGTDPLETKQCFLVPSDEGDEIVYADNDLQRLDLACTMPRPPGIPDPEGDLSPEEFHTPGLKTIADLSEFTGLPETSQMKSVVMVADREPILVMLRGDHQLSLTKLRDVLAVDELRPARAEEIRAWFGADAGSLGPVGVKNVCTFTDDALRGRKNMICGANRNDFHLRYVTPGEDFEADFKNLRQFVEGDTSILNGLPLRIEKALLPATWFWRPHAPSAIDSIVDLKDVGFMSAGRFWISLDHLLRAAVLKHHDDDGLALPPSIAPFAVIITPVFFAEEQQQRAAIDLYSSLRAAGIDALLDDRAERPGVKFKDADLIGIPYRVTIGKKLAQGIVEIRDRRARASQDVPLAEALSFLQSRLQ